MSTGNPQFNLKNSLLEIKLRKQREGEWRKITKDIESIHHIDPKIIQTVIAFNAVGLHTDNSCEGHISHGHNAPWISISVEWNKFGSVFSEYKRYVGQEEFEQKIYEQNGISFELFRKVKLNFTEYDKEYDKERLKTGNLRKLELRLMKKYGIFKKDIDNVFSVSEKVQIEVQRAVLDGMLNKETEQYKEWNKKNIEMHEKAKFLLTRFYKNRKVPDNIKIILENIDQESGSFFIHNGGLDFQHVMGSSMKNGGSEADYEKAVEAEIIKRGKQGEKELRIRLESCRAEFDAFSQFLKGQFLNEKLIT